MTISCHVQNANIDMQNSIAHNNDTRKYYIIGEKNEI